MLSKTYADNQMKCSFSFIETLCFSLIDIYFGYPVTEPLLLVGRNPRILREKLLLLCNHYSRTF